jgi:DNA-binding response OmpR family regulator
MSEEKVTNILMVEDTEEHAVLLRRALEKGKLKPSLYWVKDGIAALNYLHNLGFYADAETYPRPHLIMLDLKLPKVSGLDVLKHIKDDKKLKQIPVIILTASDEGKDIVAGYQRGADSFFTKSVLFLNKGADPTAILETVMAMAGI